MRQNDRHAGSQNEADLATREINPGSVPREGPQASDGRQCRGAACGPPHAHRKNDDHQARVNAGRGRGT